MDARLIFVLFFLFCDGNVAISDIDKRILLNDPQLLQSQIQTLNEKIKTLEQLVQKNKQDIPSLKSAIHNVDFNHGATFTIWGRKQCPELNDTYTVYSGIAGGNMHTEKGNGANPLCLPHDPETFSTPFKYQCSTCQAHLYGSEFQFSIDKVAIDDVAPCAVCRVRTASSVLMLPAKFSCPSGWTKQYQGFLAANQYDYSSTQYVCIDRSPEFFEGTRQQDYNGLLFFPVISKCGSLPCPPYIQNANLPCAVCTL